MEDLACFRLINVEVDKKQIKKRKGDWYRWKTHGSMEMLGKKLVDFFNTVLSDRIPEEWRSVLIMIFLEQRW